MQAAVLAVLVALGTLASHSRAAQPRALELRGDTMGTTYAVKVAGAGAADSTRVRSIVEAELRSVDRAMSTYDPGSELSRFNRHRSTRPFPASPAVIEVFALARRIAERTSGAFDVTVAPVLTAWGFGATDRAPGEPTARELAAARRRVGFDRVTVDADSGTLRKNRPDVACDLSGIAKGYAIDRVIEALAEAGYGDALVEVGGDLRTAGRRADGEPWRVAIERPVFRRGTVLRRLALSDRALATSGDYRSYYRSGGRRIPHLIDPRSGTPIANAVASVSVIHESAAAADALATALGVLGAREAIRLAEEEDLPALLVVRRAGGFEQVASPAFARLAESNDSEVPSR